MSNNKYRAIVKLDFQYAHRFMNYPGEASYLHGHSGLLTIEIEGDLDNHNFAYPVKEAQKLAWAVADNFHHATIFEEGDPLLDLVLQGYEKTGMKGTANRFGTPAKAIQYTTIDNPAFIWSVDVKMNSLLSFQGRDKFDDGKGEMLIQMNSLFKIVNERGEKLDEGALQRYLGEMVWFPSLALSPYIIWEQIDENTAKATMTYKGTTGSGTFYFNSNGDVTQFSALRYLGNEKDAKRYNWEMNILDYKTFEGIKVPAKMTSTWKLDDKDWTWLKLEVTDIKYNKNASY